jgi:hypothetical protein
VVDGIYQNKDYKNMTKKILTIKIRGENIHRMRELVDCIHVFLDYEDEISIEDVSLKNEI